MKYTWPILKIHNVPDIDSLIIQCLNQLKGKSLLEQLKNRGVLELHIRPLLICGNLAINKDKGCFLIYLDIEAFNNDGTPSDQTLLTFGHELAHTFECDFDTLRPFVKNRSRKYDMASDEFAELFAKKWLHNNRAELIVFLTNFPKTGFPVNISGK